MNAKAKKKEQSDPKGRYHDMGKTERRKKTKRKASGSQVRQRPEVPAKAVPQRITRSSQTNPDRPTKTDQILSLLKQPSGATLKQIMELTGWRAHSVRGFISGHVVKKIGLRVKSFRRDGERVYAVKS